MEEETTTPTSVDTGAQEAQPVEAASVEAVAASDEVTTENQETVTEAEPSQDDTSKWLQAKGIDPNDPDAITKLAKSAREAEKAMHAKAQRASELEKSLTNTSDDIAEEIAADTGQNPEVLKRLQRMEVKEAVRDFWTENPDARQYEPAMIELLQNKPHLAGDLESLYATAVLKSGKLGDVKSQGKREALESLAHKQQAAVPRGNATNSATTPKEKPFTELSLEEKRAKLGVVRR